MPYIFGSCFIAVSGNRLNLYSLYNFTGLGLELIYWCNVHYSMFTTSLVAAVYKVKGHCEHM